MEQKPGKEHPETPETINPKILHSIFEDYSRLATMCGEFEARPIKGYPRPGEDERLDESGHQVWPSNLLIEGGDLPESFDESDIEAIEITYDPTLVMEDSECKYEELVVAMHEGSGITKYIGLSRQDDNTLMPWSCLDMEEFYDSKVDQPLEEKFDDQEIEQFGYDLAEDDREVLLQDGPDGELARSVYLGVSEDELYINVIDYEDIQTLQKILPAVEAAAVDRL